VRRRFSLTLLFVSALAACRPQAETATPPERIGAAVESRLSAEQADHQRFLALYLQEQQVGGVETRVRTLPDGTVQVQDEFRFVVRRVNGDSVDEFSVQNSSFTEYAPDLSLRFEESASTEAGVVEKTVVLIEGSDLVLRYDGPAQSFEKKFPLPGEFRTSRSVFFELLDRYGQTPQQHEIEYKSFSSDEQRFVEKSMRLDGTAATEHGGQKVTGYQVVESSDDGTVVSLLVDRNYLPISLEMFGTFTAHWVDDSPFEVGTIAQITSEMPVKGTVPRWWELEDLDLHVDIKGDDPSLPALFQNGHYHDVEREGSQYRLHLKTTRPAKLDGLATVPVKPSDKDVSRFLATTPLSQSDDPAIIAASQRIVGSEKDGLKASARIVAWVYDNLEKKGGVRGNATATEVLSNKAGDCTEHAALTVALARAAGIPARNVDGIVFAGDRDGSMIAGYHAWAEVWLGQWIAVDAVFGEVGTTARYLAFGYNEPGHKGAGASLSRTVGKTSIVIDGYKLFGAEPVRLK
jgi:hypothetical protein